MSRYRLGARAAAASALAAALLWGAPLEAQLREGSGSRVVRAGFVGFGTGDDVNCPTGSGLTGGIELRTRGRWFVGAGADLYVATPAVCTDIGTIVPHESGTVDEFAGITLLFAPRLSARLGAALDHGEVRFEPSVAAGAVYAPEMWGDAERTVLPWLGGALAVHPRAWRVGFLIEHGYHRIPVSHQMRGPLGWHVVDEFGRWRRVTNVAISLRR